jgi:SAM-dependent methyltransferase
MKFLKYFESIANRDIIKKLKKFNEKEISLPFSENYYTKLFHKLAPDLFDEDGYFIQSEYEDGFLYKNGKYCREVKSPYECFNILSHIQMIKNKKLKLCDIGCGIGTICYLSEKIGYKSFGIELNKKMKPIHKSLNIDVVYGDCLKIDLSILNDVDVIYLYRPIYDDILASKLIDRIYENTKDDVIIVYTMPDDITYENDKFDRIFISTSDIVILIKK